MLERVRDAIVAGLGADLGEQGSAQFYGAIARSAITAMREPTPQMLAEAWAGITKEKNRAGIWRLGPGPGASDVWRMMIDTALNTHGSGGK